MCVLPAPLSAGNLEQRRQCARQGDESKLHRSPFRILVVSPIRLLSQPPPECSGEDVTRISGATKETLKDSELGSGTDSQVRSTLRVFVRALEGSSPTQRLPGR